MTADISYRVEPLYRRDNGSLIPNAMRFTLDIGTLKQLYGEIFATLHGFYSRGLFYRGRQMAIDRPSSTDWISQPPLHTALHQLWLDRRKGTKKGKVVVTMKDDTQRTIQRRVGYEPPLESHDFPSAYAAGRYIYESVDIGTEPGAFIFVNSFSPHRTKRDPEETPGEKAQRRQAEAHALFVYFKDRNQPRAQVVFPPDLEKLMR